MSKVAIVGNPSGTGVFTIQSPNTSTDRTLTLPDSTGTIDTLGRAGNVLQVVNASTTTQVSTSSNSLTDTTLTASITPTSSSSKILVLVNQAGCLKTGAANTRGNLQLFRNSTSLITFESGFGWNNGTADTESGACSTCYLDSPATTSSTTYKTQFSNVGATGSIVVQWVSSASTITLMEIAA